MSFYDDASLVFLPSGGAGKDGKAYSIKPVPEYGTELVTNGSFDTDSDWTKGSAWTISGGTANFDDSTNSGLSQSKSFIAGKTYKILFEITQGNASIAFLSSNGVTTYVNYATYGIGIHSVKFNYSTGSGFQIFASSFLGGSFSIDNVSVREVVEADGDFTFSRGSNLTATRVDSNGLIEKGRENLLINSVWDGVTTDTRPTGWATQFVSGTGTFDVTATEGQIRFQTLDAGSRAFIYSPTIATNGIVVVSVYVDEVTTAMPLSNLLSRSGSATDLLAYEDGVEINYSDNVQAGKRYSVVFNKTGSTTFRFGVGTSGGTLGDVVLSKPQIEIGLVATEWITSPVGSKGFAGILEHSPRFDYSGGASCPSLLLEPSRTNKMPNSEYFGGYNLGSGVTLDQNHSISPEGVQNASRVNLSTSANKGVEMSVGGTYESQTHTISVWARCASGTESFRLKCTHANVLDYFSSDFTATTEWQRFDFSKTFTATTGTGIVAGVINESGGGVKSIEIFGLQLENNSSYSTSYIPTYGSSATRDADDCGGAGDASTFNADEGVFYAEISTNTDDTDKAISLNNGVSGSLNNRLWMGYSTSNKRIYALGYVNNSLQFALSKLMTDESLFVKIACRYKRNDIAFFVNGEKVGTDTTALNFTELSSLDFNIGTAVSGASPLYGNVKQVLVFNSYLSDSEIITLTS